MTGSISFDRAADYYDQTRGLPDHLMDRLVPALVAELPDGGRCLEIGIGTGRIALPLMEQGVDVAGVDISIEMLRKLRAKPRGGEMKVVIADATRLPFADRTFASAVASHVLHLIPDWKLALDELLRVVEPGGVLLASRSADSRAEWQRAVRRRFFGAAGNPLWPPGMNRIDDLDREMRTRGAAVKVVSDVHNEVFMSISDLLAALEKGIWSACWTIDEATRRRAADETRTWAIAEFGDLEQKRPTRHESDWRAYRLEARPKTGAERFGDPGGRDAGEATSSGASANLLGSPHRGGAAERAAQELSPQIGRIGRRRSGDRFSGRAFS